MVEWNIERGLEFEAVRAAFTSPEAFSIIMEEKQSAADADERARVLEQVRILQAADLLILKWTGE